MAFFIQRIAKSNEESTTFASLDVQLKWLSHNNAHSV